VEKTQKDEVWSIFEHFDIRIGRLIIIIITLKKNNKKIILYELWVKMFSALLVVIAFLLRTEFKSSLIMIVTSNN